MDESEFVDESLDIRAQDELEGEVEDELLTDINEPVESINASLEKLTVNQFSDDDSEDEELLTDRINDCDQIGAPVVVQQMDDDLDDDEALLTDGIDDFKPAEVAPQMVDNDVSVEQKTAFAVQTFEDDDDLEDEENLLSE